MPVVPASARPGQLRLVTPDPVWHASWAAAMQEFGDEVPPGSGLLEPLADLSEQGCAQYAAWLRRGEHTPPRPDWVTCSYSWVVAEDEVVGFVSLRHELNDWLLDQGGHIGYAIRPSRRRRGYASAALGMALDQARSRGLTRVLVVCEEDNIASRRTIEGRGGAYQDSRSGKRRYWIELGDLVG